MLAALVALAIASSWPGIFNGFTYDDRFIVLDNTALHDLANWWRFFGMSYWPREWSGDGYRPLTILCLAIEWAVGHGRPLIFHLVNIGLYAAVTVAVFTLAETCVPVAGAWLAAAMFAVHPVHVEAVANVVGQAELLVALWLLIALILYVRGRRSGDFGPRRQAMVVVLYAAACVSKEQGVMLPALLLAAELTIIADAAPLRSRLVSMRPFALALILVAVAFLAGHLGVNTRAVTGFHPYAPFYTLRVGAMGRILTMFGLVPEWLRLFLWPVRLSPEYGPPANPIVSDFQLYQLPGLLIAAAVLALGLVSRRREPALAFGIWFTLITLLPVSNFFFSSAGLLSERTLFSPSIGVVIALGSAVPWAYRRIPRGIPRGWIAAAAMLVLLVAARRSMNRTRVWTDNDTLFAQAVIDMPNVYRSHFMLGSWRFDEGRAIEGEHELAVAISLYDKDPAVFFTLAEVYRTAGLFRPAAGMYQRALDIDSTLFEVRARLAVTLGELGRWPEADREARRVLKEDTHSAMAMLHIIRVAHAAAEYPVTLSNHPAPSPRVPR